MFWESKHQAKTMTTQHTCAHPWAVQTQRARIRAERAEGEKEPTPKTRLHLFLPCDPVLARFKPPCASEGGFPGARAKLKIILKLAFVSDCLFPCSTPLLLHPLHTSHISYTLMPCQYGVFPPSSSKKQCPGAPDAPFPYRCRAVSLTPPPSDPLAKSPQPRWGKRQDGEILSEHTDPTATSSKAGPNRGG